MELRFSRGLISQVMGGHRVRRNAGSSQELLIERADLKTITHLGRPAIGLVHDQGSDVTEGLPPGSRVHLFALAHFGQGQHKGIMELGAKSHHSWGALCSRCQDAESSSCVRNKAHAIGCRSRASLEDYAADDT